MIYACPYCKVENYSGSRKRNKFSNWESVNNHLKGCKLNTRKYIICANYGPISIEEIEQCGTIENFKRKYPNFSRNSHHYFTTLRERRGLKITTTRWTNQDCIDWIQKFYNENNKIPVRKDADDAKYKHPSASTIERKFGTWNNAIIAAGFEPYQKGKFGAKTLGKDGQLYKSRLEAKFVDDYLFKKYEYIYEKQYGNGWYYDFYLPALNLCIEIDGNLRSERLQEKINFCTEKNIKLVIFNENQIYNKDYVQKYLI